MSVVKEPILNHWYRALHSPYGIELVCSDVGLTRSQLYAARKEAQDLDLSDIAICQSRFDPMRLWLVKRNPTDAKA